MYLQSKESTYHRDPARILKALLCTYVQIKAATDLEDGMLLIKLTHTISCYSTLVRTLTMKLDKDRLYAV
jgi:hypothetical protein